MQVEGGDLLTPLAEGRSMWGLTPSTSSGAAPATPSRRASSFFVKDKDAPILMPVEQGSDLRTAPRPPAVQKHQQTEQKSWVLLKNSCAVRSALWQALS